MLVVGISVLMQLLVCVTGLRALLVLVAALASSIINNISAVLVPKQNGTA